MTPSTENLFEQRPAGTAPSDGIPVDSEDRPIPRDMTSAVGQHGTSIDRAVQRTMSRRGFLHAIAIGAGATVAMRAQSRVASLLDDTPSTLHFDEVANVTTDTHAVAAGYDASVLIRWGDPVLANAPAFDPSALTAAAQATQFGYNNDFLAFLPLGQESAGEESAGEESAGEESAVSRHGLLCVNHEYTNCNLMWDGVEYGTTLTPEQAAVEMAAHGHSVLEVRRGDDGKWSVVHGSRYARRITADTTVALSGPVAGHPRVRTSVDLRGDRVQGTFNNCGGGMTPWGTVLIAEENVNKYFTGDPSKVPSKRERRSLERYGFGDPEFLWGHHHSRLDLEHEPHEANRFGWLVEVNPHAPESTPIKRTALGRFKHEAAGVTQSHDGRVAVYMGDDQAMEYVYRFVTNQAPDARGHGDQGHVLDDGTLYVARFADDGSGQWIPMVFGTGPLTQANGFDSQADVLIEARRAADLLEATPMDRPEDLEVHPKTGAIFVMLTNNKTRTLDQRHPVNPRAENRYGHIVEITQPRASNGKTDHTSDVFRWDILLRGGNPNTPTHGASYHNATSTNGWFVCPDNATFDPSGRLWIATDQGSAQDKNGVPDGIRACDVSGPGRALTKLFFRAPRNAEVTGPCFTPDGSTLFVSVQHPGESRKSTFANPTTRWPDFDDNTPPRPAILAITKDDGGRIGGSAV